MTGTDVMNAPAGTTGTTAPVISVILVSYNTREMTLEALRSLKRETTVAHEVIVVDNASTDGSAEAIAAEFPEHLLLAESTNHGFAPAHDIALPHASGEYLLLLNPDTVVLDGAVDKLFAFAKAQPQAKIWGGRTWYGDMSLNPTSCFRAMTLWSIATRVLGLNGIFRRSDVFNPEYYGDWQRDTVREVEIVTGCFFLIPRAFWDELDGFDPAFTMYGEEVDLCLRARAKGARPMITPEASIIHYGGASQAVAADKNIRMMRAKMELIKRHFAGWQRPFALWLFALWPLSRATMGGIVPGRGKGVSVWREVWTRRHEWRDGFQA